MPPIDISNAWKSGARIINSSIALLPNFVLAIIIFVLFSVLASASKSLTRRFTMRRRTHRGVAIRQQTRGSDHVRSDPSERRLRHGGFRNPGICDAMDAGYEDRLPQRVGELQRRIAICSVKFQCRPDQSSASRIELLGFDGSYFTLAVWPAAMRLRWAASSRPVMSWAVS
jgi:hypothetical protein